MDPTFEPSCCRVNKILGKLWQGDKSQIVLFFFKPDMHEEEKYNHDSNKVRTLCKTRIQKNAMICKNFLTCIQLNTHSTKILDISG